MMAEKYRPSHLSELVGQSENVNLLRRWAKSWEDNNPAYKSVFIYGSPGVGKTAAAHALANDFNWEILEINASDQRNSIQLKNKIGHAIYFKPWQTRCLIIIDEADNITKKGFQILAELIQESVNPVIVICNDEYAVKRATDYFRENSLMLLFRKLRDNDLRNVITTISDKESIQVPDIDKLIKASSGDLRYALNNLTTEVEIKETTDNTFSVVHDIFAGGWNGDISDVDFEFLWKVIKYNMPGFYDDIYGQNVYEFISDVDRIMDSIYRNYQGTESYRFWGYLISILKLLPRHQKTQRIDVPKSFNERNRTISKANINDNTKIVAQNVHMGVINAYRMLQEFPDLTKPALSKPEVTVSKSITETKVDIPKKSKTLFDYASS